jgi:phosphoserine phosphatase
MSEHVLTLIGAEATPAAVEIGKAIGTARIDWLAPDFACDLFFDAVAPDAAYRAACEAIGAAAVDAVIQKASGRRKRLLVADLESTIIENEMLDDMAGLLGLRERVAEITRRGMNGELDFAASLRARVALFKGQPETILTRAAEGIRVTPGARTLVATMTAHGAKAVLVTGGFHVFSRPIREALGFTRDYANDLIVENGSLAGTVREPILSGVGKLDTMRERAAEFGISLGETLAVGDGANDMPMLHAAGLGIAYHAKPHVRDQVRARVEHTDLTSLLFIQGYRKTEFVG